MGENKVREGMEVRIQEGGSEGARQGHLPSGNTIELFIQ